uniref:Importin N-terminal domain-containing protein n=1 Tax=Biomphalaria glabrata TaxID=6526 RepID=A0A2C9JGA5_BIOGL
MSFSMDSAPSLELVNQALQALYNNPDVTGKEKASVWLGELQKSVFAWQVADQLLTLNQSLESCYFAAQTMRTKIQYAFHELPADSHQSLRDSLLEHASKIAPGTPPVIVTQLSLALADLALQMATWKSAVLDFVERFSKDHLGFLLEVLTVLPEEISSRSLRLGANRRKEVTEELIEASPTIIQLLTHVASPTINSNSRLHLNVILIPNLFQASPTYVILQYLLAGLQQPVLASIAANSLQSICTQCKDQMTNHFDGLMHIVRAMESFNLSPDAALGLLKEKGLGTFQLLDLLLMCVNHHLYEVSEVTFNFWYRLSEELYQRNSQEITDLFKPYIQNLVLALCQHCHMDEDHEGIPDESGDFGDFRVRVSELIKDVVFIAGSSSCFVQMFESLKSPKNPSWAVSEAALFIMSAVAKNILPDLLPSLLGPWMCMHPSASLSMQHSMLWLLWRRLWLRLNRIQLRDLERYHELAQRLFQGVMSLVPAYHEADKDEESDKCLNYCRIFTELSESLFHMLLATPNQKHNMLWLYSFSSTSLEFSYYPVFCQMFFGTATILGRLPYANIGSALSQLCASQIGPLERLLNEESGPVRQGSANDPVIWLDRLAAIFRHTNPSVSNGQTHPCQGVVVEVWPVLSRSCEKYQSDVRIIERCCRCIRFAIRCLGRNSATLLTPLVTQMVGLYQTHQHSCFLYLGSILVDEYGKEAGCVPGLLDMLQAFCGPTFKILEEHNGLRNHPDTVDDLFRLCLRFIQRAPVPFLQSALAKPIMCCAIAACSLDHKDANASVMKFLSDMIKCVREKEDRDDFEVRHTLVKKLLEEHGQSLVIALINACLFCLPTFMSADVSEVLYELMIIDRPMFCLWLEHTLKALPTESSGGAITATKKQLADFHKACTSAEDIKQVSSSVRDFCRLYR